MKRREVRSKEERREEVVSIPIDLIEPDPRQPRKYFHEEKIRELAESIRLHGLLQPILVRPTEKGTYQIVHGERRYRACRLLGLKKINCIIRDLPNEEVPVIQLIENLQREDLTPLEEAQIYKRLVEEFGFTHEEIARMIGKSREYVSNKLRLLKLPKTVQEALIEGKITEGHAKAILSVKKEDQERVFQKVVEENFTVRDTERYVREISVPRGTENRTENRTLLIPISSSLYDQVYRLARKLRMKTEKLVEVALLDFVNRKNGGLER